MRQLRPHSSLFWQGLLACVVFLAPVFVVLYVLTIPNGPWPAVVFTQFLATLAVSLLGAGFFSATIWIGPGAIAERGFFGRKTRFERSAIGSILLAHTYTGPDLTPVPQLFVRDHDGHQLVRMRGQFWSREMMDDVIRLLDVPVTVSDDPVSIAELRDDHPQLLYWFERHPVWAALAFSGAVVAFGALLLLVLHLIGTL
jgi:hypothetical protein